MRNTYVWTWVVLTMKYCKYVGKPCVKASSNKFVVIHHRVQWARPVGSHSFWATKYDHKL